MELGRRALVSGDYAAAAARLEPVVRRHPELLRAHRLLGAAYLGDGKANEAIPHFQLAVGQDSTDLAALEDLGTAYLVVQQYRPAITSYHRVLLVKPDNSTVLLRRGYAYQQLGKLDSATSDYRKVLSIPRAAVKDGVRHEAARLLDSLSGH